MRMMSVIQWMMTSLAVAFEMILRAAVWNDLPFFYGELAEWLMAAVLKTVDGDDEPSVGSNPTLPATFFDWRTVKCQTVWII